jgi:hypothetical protein
LYKKENYPFKLFAAAAIKFSLNNKTSLILLSFLEKDNILCKENKSSLLK